MVTNLKKILQALTEGGQIYPFFNIILVLSLVIIYFAVLFFSPSLCGEHCIYILWICWAFGIRLGRHDQSQK